ncbi:hypothetical protein [Deinococcus aquaticus]|uniref:Phage holin family protein n=1 Tax=Deinococcus aquaticus TaxID=328692 RepID=A0ABY7V896_9DEIO|nr:hypothetical protein [Deinococcus aquaticus]WDA60653.1 hypothetical protein M8445_16940 [Deinococcus aquaticus]
MKKGWATLQFRQRTAAQRQGSDIEAKALELAVDNQGLLVWIGGTLMAMLTVAMLVLAELFLVLAMLNPSGATWGCWLGAVLAIGAAWLGYRFCAVLDKVQDALNTAPSAQV